MTLRERLAVLVAEVLEKDNEQSTMLDDAKAVAKVIGIEFRNIRSVVDRAEKTLFGEGPLVTQEDEVKEEEEVELEKHGTGVAANNVYLRDVHDQDWPTDVPCLSELAKRALHCRNLRDSRLHQIVKWRRFTCDHCDSWNLEGREGMTWSSREAPYTTVDERLDLLRRGLYYPHWFCKECWASVGRVQGPWEYHRAKRQRRYQH